MSEQRFCSHCGQRVSTDADQRFCQFCGKPLDAMPMQAPYVAPPMMGYSYAPIPQPQAMAMPSAPAYKPNWWQDLAAVVSFIVVFGGYVLRIYFPELYTYSPDYMDWDVGLGRFVPLLMAGGLAFLLKGAKNSATLTAVIIWMALNVINGFLSFFPPKIESEVSGVLFYEVRPIVFSIVFVYVCSLIAQNNVMSASCRKWLNLLVVMEIAYCSITFIYFAYDVFWNPPFGNKVFIGLRYIDVLHLYVMPLLSVCCNWVLARSEVFSGPYDNRKSCNFSPLNRKMALAIISPVVFFLLFFLLFELGDDLNVERLWN